MLLLAMAACRPEVGDYAGLLDWLPPASLGTNAAPEDWAVSHARYLLDLSYADVPVGEDPFDDPSCPTKADTDAGTTFIGGCSDEDGTEWFGTLVVTEEQVHAEGFGTSYQQLFGPDCEMRMWGDVDRTADDDVQRYDINAGMYEVCGDDNVRQAWVVDYGLAVTWAEEDGIGSVAHYDGFGRFGIETKGSADVATAGMFFGECGTEPLGGESTVTSKDRTLRYVYNAGVVADCEEDLDGQVPVFRDGQFVEKVEFPVFETCGTPLEATPVPAVLAALFLSRRRRCS